MARIIDTIEKRGAKKIGLQLPEGLKRLGPEIARKIEECTGVVVYISGNPCYGACDIDEQLRKHVDLMFHFGHAPCTTSKKWWTCNSYGVSGDRRSGGVVVPSELQHAPGRHPADVIFIETRSNADIRPVLERAVKILEGDTIGLITTVQHIHQLKEAHDILSRYGKTCIIGSGDSRLKYKGQILGCNFSAARVDVDEFIYIGSGNFHPLGVTLATSKRVIIADPTSNEVREINPEPILRQRHAAIARALDAETLGIIICTKDGQMRADLADKLWKKARKKGIVAYLILMDEITPGRLNAFKADAFVNTGCPRIAIDDAALFKIPMLTPIEFEIVLGDRGWDEIQFDEFHDVLPEKIIGMNE